jgi:hypothetical protein
MANVKKDIEKWRRRFRHILKGWTINYDPKDKTKAKVWIDHKHKSAIIFAFGKRKVPADYVLHEMLHVCFRAVKHSKDWVWREELLVRELCNLIKPA